MSYNTQKQKLQKLINKINKNAIDLDSRKKPNILSYSVNWIGNTRFDTDWIEISEMPE